jgi:Ferritin-like domain
MHYPGMTRAGLLSRGVGAATALAFGGAFAGTARADTLPDADLAQLRVLIASELLAVDFYTKAVASKQFAGSVAATLRRSLVHERAHYTALAQVLSAAGQVAAVADDIDFAYPKRAFDSRGSIARLGVRLETVFVGVALGAAAGLQTASVRLPVAQIAASEAQHLASFSILTGRGPIGAAFPAALSIDQATSALDAFES